MQTGGHQVSGKRRTPEQRIGDIGEDHFRLFCTSNNLLPTKVERDYGLDFLCQVDLAASLSQTGTLAGTPVGFSVRATARADGRIKLTRSDAECLLAAELPVALALVNLRDGQGTEIYFRFLDRDFIVELHEFLSSAKKVKHFKPADLKSAAIFRDELAPALAPGFVEKARVAAAELLASPVEGAVCVEVRRGSQGELTLTTAFDFYRLFDRRSPDQLKALMIATFGAPRFRDDRLSRLALNAGLCGGLARLPAPYMLRGFMMDGPASMRIRGADDGVELSLLKTADEHHVGWVHEAGVAFIGGERRIDQDGHYVHDMEILVDADSDSPLAAHPELVSFLGTCRPGTLIEFDAPGSFALEAECFEGIATCSDFASAFIAASGLPGWDQVRVSVKDLASEESLKSMLWLASAAVPSSHVAPRGLFIKDVEASDCTAVEAVVHLPVVCNLVDGAVVVWLSGDGVVYHHHDEPCGFMVNVFGSREVTTTRRLSKETDLPEAVLGVGNIALSREGPLAIDQPKQDWGEIRLSFEPI